MAVNDREATTAGLDDQDTCANCGAPAKFLNYGFPMCGDCR